MPDIVKTGGIVLGGLAVIAASFFGGRATVDDSIGDAGVAVANSDGCAVFFDGVEVDGDAVWCTNLVLAAVFFTDSAGIIPIDRVFLRQLLINSFGLGN